MTSSRVTLLGLSPELRNMIYEFWAVEYVQGRDCIFIRSGNLVFQARRGYPALLQTCKQINREAYGIFLKADRLQVMPAKGDQVYVHGVSTSNMTHDVPPANLKIRMRTWLATKHTIFLLFILFETEDVQRAVFKIGPDVFTWRRPEDDTYIGTTAQVEESKLDSPGFFVPLASAVLVEAHQSSYLLFMMYVIGRGGSAWKHAMTVKR